MNTEEIRRELFCMQDESYRDFQSKLIPGFSKEQMIGVRTPQLRLFARTLMKEGESSAFLEVLPHAYFDENQLHAFMISEIRDAQEAFARVDAFLPFVDNWATCDQLSPKVFRRHKEELLAHIRRWIRSEHVYTVRFGIGMLMQHFLEEDYSPEYPKMVCRVPAEEYYVHMMVAWYFATALAKQYEAVLPYLEEKRLDPKTHNKTIQKAVESYRITPEQKAYLKTLRI